MNMQTLLPHKGLHTDRCRHRNISVNQKENLYRKGTEKFLKKVKELIELYIDIVIICKVNKIHRRHRFSIGGAFCIACKSATSTTCRLFW